MSALSGLDIALWDLKGKKLGVPVWQLLVRPMLLAQSKRGRAGDLTLLRFAGWSSPRQDPGLRMDWRRPTSGHSRPGQEAQGRGIHDGQDERFRVCELESFCVLLSQKLRLMFLVRQLGWLASPADLDATVERLKEVKSIGMDAGLDFHGRVHKPMAKQLARKLEPHSPLFIEEPMLPGQIEELKKLYAQTTIPIAVSLLEDGVDVRIDLRADGCLAPYPPSAWRATPHSTGRPTVPRGRMHRHHPA